MSGTSKYKGITYGIPNTDDGKWRWVVYTIDGRKGLAALNAQPRPVYPTHADAVQAVKLVIDAEVELQATKAKTPAKAATWRNLK
jgi:hypothetical protein